MNADPLDIALRSVTETKQLLEALITSSESFDYVKAKRALEQMQVKTRELAKLKAQLEARRVTASNIRVLSFQNQGLA